MSEHAPPPGTVPPDLRQRLDELTAQVHDLRRELSGLIDDLAREVRTRRLTIVEDDGFERLVAAGRGHFGHLTLRGRAPVGRSTLVELFANDPADGDDTNVGAALCDHGDVVASIDVTRGSPPALWWSDADDGG